MSNLSTVCFFNPYVGCTSSVSDILIPYFAGCGIICHPTEKTNRKTPNNLFSVCFHQVWGATRFGPLWILAGVSDVKSHLKIIWFLTPSIVVFKYYFIHHISTILVVFALFSFLTVLFGHVRFVFWNWVLLETWECKWVCLETTIGQLLF